MRNLHSVPWADPLRDFSSFAQQLGTPGVGLGYQAEWYRRAIEGRFLNYPLRDGVDMFVNRDEHGTLNFRQVRGTRDALSIIARLERAYHEVSYRRIEGLALVITPREAQTLRTELDWHDLDRYFGPEGARMNFRGMPLVIQD